MNSDLNLSNLGVLLRRAYRKTKVDLFYSNDDRALDLIKFEENLDENLSALADFIRKALAEEEKVNFSDDFLGSFVLIAKNNELDENTEGKQDSNATFSSSIDTSPRQRWGHFLEGDEGKATISYRILSKCSVEFHILSQLWVERIGEKLDLALGSSSGVSDGSGKQSTNTVAYGNRVRRDRNGEYNSLAPSTLEPYLFPYQRWQNRGLETAERRLDEGDAVVVITADIASFFPNLNTDFLLESEFLKACDVQLQNNSNDLRLHTLFVNALSQWTQKTEKDLGQGFEGLKVGVPMGVAASAIVANTALVDLDRLVKKELNPLFYGRYVDDILLVLSDNKQFRTENDLIEWILRRTQKSAVVHGDARLQRPPEEDKVFKFEADYLEGSELLFSKEKFKAQLLTGTSGKAQLLKIRQSIQERASEWRELPVLSNDPDGVSLSIVSAVTTEGTPADTFQALDKITVDRAAFALTLRDVEAYAHDIDPCSWAHHRKEFFITVANFVLSPVEIFSFERYLGRILTIALVTKDWGGLEQLVRAVTDSYADIKRGSDNTHFELLTQQINSVTFQKLDDAVSTASRTEKPDPLQRWGSYLQNTIVKTILKGASEELPEATKDQINEYLKTLGISGIEGSLTHIPEDSAQWHAKLLLSDLATMPLRTAILPLDWGGLSEQDWDTQFRNILPVKIAPQQDETNYLNRLIKSGSTAAQQNSIILESTGGLFPTRPPTPAELFGLLRVLNTGDSEKTSIDDVFKLLKFTRGYHIEEAKRPSLEGSKITIGNSLHDGCNHKSVSGTGISAVAVALLLLSTNEKQLVGAAHGTPDLSRERYATIFRTINRIVAEHKEVSYVLLPELSLPLPWFMRISHKLRNLGVSLISGVEYRSSSKGEIMPGLSGLHNQIWASFATDEWGFPSNIIYVQDKQRPSPHEKEHLLQHDHVLDPEKPWEKVPIVNHNGIYMATLVCSELTNISYRARLRGKIDVLWLPQWNQDTKTFSSLVEATAGDIHCFVAQANNGEFGDTRIRAPYKESWKRDIAQISNRGENNFVIGKLDIAALRRFQSKASTAAEKFEFKPLPDGFKIHTRRRKTSWH